MPFKEVIIFTREEPDYWELSIIKGALNYHNISYRVLDYESLCEAYNNTLYVAIVHSKKEITFLSQFEGTIVYVGFNITLEYLHDPFSIAENEILILGEPYATVPQLVNNPTLLKQSMGKVIYGALYDVREYCAHKATTKQKSWVSVMTSIGCNKKCGYCSYGFTNSTIYPKQFIRRVRPWQDIYKEIICYMEEGITQFSLSANQFLSADPQENEELLSLVNNWKQGELGKPSIIFTVSPLEVLNNKHIIEALSNSFNIYPRFSIDSFDNETLKLLDMDFDASVAMEALEFLAYLKLPIRINYIFIKPNITMERVKEEFIHFKSLATALSYLKSHQKLLIAHDLFSVSLDIMRGTPIAYKEGVKKDYKAHLPTELLGVISKIQSTMGDLIKSCQTGSVVDPLTTIVEAGLNEIKGRAT